MLSASLCVLGFVAGMLCTGFACLKARIRERKEVIKQFVKLKM